MQAISSSWLECGEERILFVMLPAVSELSFIAFSPGEYGTTFASKRVCEASVW